MTLIQDYIVALTNLYGLVHKRKVVSIYNGKNEPPIDEETINTIMEESAEQLENRFVYLEAEYFVHEAIIMFDDINEEIIKRHGKPHYVPSEEELLKYTYEPYFEKTKQYNDLLHYMTTHLFGGNKLDAENICEHIQGMIEQENSLQTIFSEMDYFGIAFDDKTQANDVIELIIDLSNNTRLWSNNGHTPIEIEAYQPNYLAQTHPFKMNNVNKQKTKPKLSVVSNERKEKIGRNDPCPCGSGKKHKKCCGKG